MIDKPILAEEFVEEQPDMVGCPPIGMDEEVGGGFEFREGWFEAITEPLEPGVSAIP